MRHDGGVIVKNIYRTEGERYMQKLFAVICSCLQLFEFRRNAKNGCSIFAVSINDNDNENDNGPLTVASTCGSEG